MIQQKSRSHRHRRLQSKSILFICVLLGSGASLFIHAQTSESQRDTADRELAAVYRLGGQPIGTYKEQRSHDSAGNIVTQLDSTMVFNRLGTKLEIKSTSRYLETPAGELMSIDNTSSSSQQSTIIHAMVNKDSITVTTTTGGHSYPRIVAFTGRLVGPEAARELAVARLHIAGDTVSYQTFSPELGHIVTVTDKVLAHNDSPGTNQESGLKIEQTMSSMPSALTLWVDNAGWLLRQVMSSPLGEIETLRADYAIAENAPANASTMSAESFNQSVVTANIRLPEERRIEAIKLKIIARHPGIKWPDFTADNQKVLEKTPEYLVMEVTRPMPQSDSSRPVAAEASLQPYLEPNPLLQSDDAGVRQIEASVVHEGDSAWTAARALQRWTAANMHFDLGIAVVSASEVAKNRGGTCFGYSVLLASLARAAGIPSRIRVGLVYAGGIWGGHAWVELLIGSRWIPLDGALYAPGPADAARFSVFTGSFEEGTVGNLGMLGEVMGNVDIKILEYTLNGKNTIVNEDAAPYTIAGDAYHNPWIGLSLTKPSNFRFTGYDLSWPQTTLIAIEGPAGECVEIHSESVSLPTAAEDKDKVFRSEGFNGSIHVRHISAYNGLFSANEKGAAMLIEHGGSMWLVKATAKQPVALLEQVVSSMKLE